MAGYWAAHPGHQLTKKTGHLSNLQSWINTQHLSEHITHQRFNFLVIFWPTAFQPQQK